MLSESEQTGQKKATRKCSENLSNLQLQSGGMNADEREKSAEQQANENEKKKLKLEIEIEPSNVDEIANAEKHTGPAIKTFKIFSRS